MSRPELTDVGIAVQKGVAGEFEPLGPGTQADLHALVEVVRAEDGPWSVRGTGPVPVPERSSCVPQPRPLRVVVCPSEPHPATCPVQ